MYENAPGGAVPYFDPDGNPIQPSTIQAVAINHLAKSFRMMAENQERMTIMSERVIQTYERLLERLEPMLEKVITTVEKDMDKDSVDVVDLDTDLGDGPRGPTYRS